MVGVLIMLYSDDDGLVVLFCLVFKQVVILLIYCSDEEWIFVFEYCQLLECELLVSLYVGELICVMIDDCDL